ncbi:MAG: restriction endonuclease [Deltaproteobacteria bacterium]|nr:restriction endonuclease [Deltaproteobacteria bacterium]
MSDIAIKNGLTGLLMRVSVDGGELTLPFGRDIFLINTHVAGTAYYDAPQSLDRIRQAKTLILKRQPDNSHDDLAIEVFTPDGKKLGYVPRKSNPILARLMDAGKIITATLADCDDEVHGKWVDLRMDIVLKDL